MVMMIIITVYKKGGQCPILSAHCLPIETDLGPLPFLYSYITQTIQCMHDICTFSPRAKILASFFSTLNVQLFRQSVRFSNKMNNLSTKMNVYRIQSEMFSRDNVCGIRDKYHVYAMHYKYYTLALLYTVTL